MGNNFIATADWFDANQETAAAFLALWERGVQDWRENQAEIIRTYPQHFAVEEEEDVKYIQEYMSERDWFVDSVFLDDAWIEGETALFDLMKETGFMEEDVEEPRFEVVEPPDA